MTGITQKRAPRSILRLCLLCISLTLTACSTHYGHALLYEKDAVSDTYHFASTSSNAIRIPADSQFRIALDDIHPGWLHQSERKKSPDRSNGNWTRKQASHLFDKELWILTRIESLSNTDILERESKVYFKATNIKLNSTSFLPVGLDIAERNLFEHTADSSYRVSISIYEVDGFALKRAIGKAYDSSPGISGLVMDLLGTLKSLGLGALGNTLVDMVIKPQTGKSELERLLVQLGSSKEFGTTFHILRTSSDDNTTGRPGTARELLFYDKLKSDPSWSFNIDGQHPDESQKSFKAALKDLKNDQLKLDEGLAESTYVTLNVTWGQINDAGQLKGRKLTETEQQSNEDFIKSFKSD